MLPLAFIGGAVTGAAGLLAAVLYNSHKAESEYSPLLKTPEHLDAAEVVGQLNVYFFKANSMHFKCSEIVMDSIHLAFRSIPLPDDGFFQKTANVIGDSMTGVCRGWRRDALLALKDDCQKLYGRYRGVFRRANAILRERGETPINLNAITFKGQDFSINKSLENEDWHLDFEALADRIRDFLDTSCAIAEQLVGILERKDGPIAIGHETTNA